ncbi:uncharacterized protein BT62DRAFT_934422 [Guyanagaster necrorhizus]|uniref:Uncharacterized protein n=1 Tax=Guyanagaster necrorhizus TaxID=856835 RepID=A0A9P7VPD9_9AGAR|nr:uncharacterized protein BT62DRAFT_934422 [Guyanagaster necrorhizus MCA 3950]KAG7444248.1 hypothetical protein BT62DRAFT_934422 [Guyanagaster necrorhizus MCA 3950]
MLRWVQSTARNLDGCGILRRYFVCRACHGNVTIAGSRRALAERNYSLSTPSTHLSSDVSSSSLVSSGTLLTLYREVKQAHQVSSLSHSQLSKLIRLYGKLSTDLDASEQGASSTIHREFVREVASDMETLGYELGEEDRCWVLRGLLASSSTDPTSLWLARHHYEHLRMSPIDVNLHLAYYRTLMSSGNPQSVTEVLHHVSIIFERFPNPASEIIEFIWPIILNQDIPDVAGEHVLSMVWTRLTQFKGANSHLKRAPTLGTTRVLDAHSQSYGPATISIEHLAVGFGMAFLPHFYVSLPLSVQQWVRVQAQNVFNPHNDTSWRWRQLKIFLVHSSKSAKTLGQHLIPLTDKPDDPALGWSTVLVLVSLETLVKDGKWPSSPVIQSTVRRLWRLWQLSVQDSPRPQFVERAVVASFLRLGAHTADRSLVDICRRYILSEDLWTTRKDHTRAEKIQIISLAADFVVCYFRSISPSWDDALRVLSMAFDGPNASDVLEVVFRMIMTSDTLSAFALYLHSQEADITLAPSIVCALGFLMAPIQPERSILFLYDTRLLRQRRTQLLEAISRSLFRHGVCHLSESSAGTIGDHLLHLPDSEYPFLLIRRNQGHIQHTLTVIGQSGYSMKAFGAVQRIHRSNPGFFSMTFLAGFAQLLVRRRRFKLAVDLYMTLLGTVSDAAQLEILRQRLVYNIARNGGTLVARTIARSTSTNIRERMASHSGFRLRDPPRSTAMNVFSTLRETPSDVASIKLAIYILTKAKRPVAARNLYARSLQYLEVPARTHMGNMILHRTFQSFRVRNAQLVRKVIANRDYFVKRYGFVEDRVTLNIILKAVLRWTTVVDAAAVRMLFDEVVRLGYPVDARWLPREGDVPFSTPSQSRIRFTIPDLDAEISFERHVRPMYRMFITAFFQRDDAEAARLVVGILKTEVEKRRAPKGRNIRT